MIKRFATLFLVSQIYISGAWAATSPAAVSTTGSVLKMVFGLAVVLGVMVLVSWGVKRMMPGVTGQQSGIRIVGGVSVGSRERVVVVQVADRWIVVGVAPGQVNGIANLEAGASVMTAAGIDSTMQSEQQQSPAQFAVHPAMQPLVKPFSEWLKKSAEKAKGMTGGSAHAKE